MSRSVIATARGTSLRSSSLAQRRVVRSSVWKNVLALDRDSPTSVRAARYSAGVMVALHSSNGGPSHAAASF